MTSTPEPADERLLASHDLALAALHDITPASTVGPAAGYTVEADGVVSLRFANTMPGYPGWFWTVSVAAVDGAEPTVLEAELLPGEGALLAPDWVPWAVRLAEYQAAQAALALERADASEEDLEEREDDELDDGDQDADDDFEDLDAADFDEDGSPILHAGDVDGVDIDVLDESTDDGDDEDDSDEDDSDEDDSDDSDEELSEG